MGENKGAAEVVDRKEGYYWVKYRGQFIVVEYIIGITENWWKIMDSENYYLDENFEEIDERQICRS